jgi:hypothetical protein
MSRVRLDVKSQSDAAAPGSSSAIVNKLFSTPKRASAQPLGGPSLKRARAEGAASAASSVAAVCMTSEEASASSCPPSVLSRQQVEVANQSLLHAAERTLQAKATAEIEAESVAHQAAAAASMKIQCAYQYPFLGTTLPISGPMFAACHSFFIASGAALDTQSASHSRNVLRANSVHASLAQRCYTDALHSVFKFLWLRELPSILCCRFWRDAASKEKPCRDVQKLEFESETGVKLMCLSPLRIHVTTLKLCLSVNLSSLLLLRDHLPRLTHLTVTPTQSGVKATARSVERHVFLRFFPSSLVSLELDLSIYDQLECPAVNLLIEAAATSALQLVTLTVKNVSGAAYERLDLQPLVRLIKLMTLKLEPDIFLNVNCNRGRWQCCDRFLL